MKKVLFILFATLLFVACKKENRIERNLWKQGGEWNIESIEQSSTSSQYPEDNYSGVDYNAGTFKFTKDGKATITTAEDNSAYVEHFTYENTETSLTLFDEDGDGLVFDLDWKRNELTLSFKESDSYQSIDENFNPITVHTTSSTRINCEKK